MDKTNIWLINLQFFAGEGGEGGMGEGPAGVTEGQEAAAPVNTPRRARRGTEPLNVRYGIIEDDARGQAAAANAGEETFESLTGKGGKYEQAFKDATQQIVRRRLGENKELQTKLDSHQPIMQLLAQRYNIAPNEANEIDTAALMNALEDDRKYYEDRAFREGVTPEQLMREEKLARQQKAINDQREAERREAQMRNQYQQLTMQAVKMMADIPDFDLDRELENPTFARMVMTGTPVENAYYAVHHREIMQARESQQRQATYAAVQQAQQMTANAIASGTRRPTENGASGAAPAQHITDPSQLTRAQRLDIRRRVKAGERIIW